MGPARIQCGKNRTGGMGQQAILEAGYHRMLHWRPVHPRAVYTACSLSSAPAPMHPSLHNQHPESPDHETVVSSNVYSGSRGTRARAGNVSKAHVRHRCHDTHQPLPSAFLSQAMLLLQAHWAPAGREGSPVITCCPVGTRSPRRARRKTQFTAGEARLGNGVGGSTYLPLLVGKMIPLSSPQQPPEKMRESAPEAACIPPEEIPNKNFPECDPGNL